MLASDAHTKPVSISHLTVKKKNRATGFSHGSTPRKGGELLFTPSQLFNDERRVTTMHPQIRVAMVPQSGIEPEPSKVRKTKGGNETDGFNCYTGVNSDYD